MTGHDDERLQDYLDGRLAGDERDAFERRIEADPELAERVREHLRLRRDLRDPAGDDLPPGFYTRARARFVERHGVARRPWRFAPSWEALGVATAAVVLAALFLPPLWRDGDLPPEVQRALDSPERTAAAAAPPPGADDDRALAEPESVTLSRVQARDAPDAAPAPDEADEELAAARFRRKASVLQDVAETEPVPPGAKNEAKKVVETLKTELERRSTAAEKRRGPAPEAPRAGARSEGFFAFRPSAKEDAREGARRGAPPLEEQVAQNVAQLEVGSRTTESPEGDPGDLGDKDDEEVRQSLVYRTPVPATSKTVPAEEGRARGHASAPAPPAAPPTPADEKRADALTPEIAAAVPPEADVSYETAVAGTLGGQTGGKDERRAARSHPLPPGILDPGAVVVIEQGRDWRSWQPLLAFGDGVFHEQGAATPVAANQATETGRTDVSPDFRTERAVLIGARARPFDCARAGWTRDGEVLRVLVPVAAPGSTGNEACLVLVPAGDERVEVTVAE